MRTGTPGSAGGARRSGALSRAGLRGTRLDVFTLAAATALGWVYHDLAVFLAGGEAPRVLEELLPGSLLLVLAIGAAGVLISAWRPLILVLILAAGVLSVLPLLAEQRLPMTRLWQPRVVAAMAVVIWAGGQAHARWGIGPVRLGLAGGALACAFKSALRNDPLTAELLAVALPALLALALGALRHDRLRRALTAALVVASLGAVAWSARTGATHLRADLEPPTVAARPDAPNLVLVVLDTLRADHLRPYGYERETTPRLDAFVRDHATLHTQARSTSSITLASHGSLFTGLFPAQHGATVGGPESRPLRPDVPTLAGRLREAGYRTGAIVSNVLYLNRFLGLDRGFEHFDERRGTQVGEYVALLQIAGRKLGFGHKHRDARSITDLALRWLDRTDGAFFLFLNYMEPHGPRVPPPAPFDRAFSDHFPARPLRPAKRYFRLLYDRDLLYMDFHLGRLLEGLEQRGLFDDTLIVVTSDHGEAFGEHGFWDHCWTLYEELVHVPLYVKPPGGRERAVDDRPMTAPDVHDLALRELGLEPAGRGEVPGLVGEWYPWTLLPGNRRLARRLGRDLRVDLLAWMRGGVKTIVASNGRVEAYDLVRDPDELEALRLTDEEIEAARREARAWWDANPHRTDPVELDAEQLERLAELGYGG